MSRTPDRLTRDEREQRILAYVRRNPGSTSRRCASGTGLNPGSTWHDIDRLVTARKLRRVRGRDRVSMFYPPEAT